MKKRGWNGWGGRVRLAPQSGGTSRVLYADRKSGREWGLAMSRSIGDMDAGKVGVIPDPIVDVLRLEDLMSSTEGELCTVAADGGRECSPTKAVVNGDIEVFAASATDGLLDFVSVETVANHVAKGLYAIDDDSFHLITACYDLIGEAANGWQRAKQGRYRNDIAIAVSCLT